EIFGVLAGLVPATHAFLCLAAASKTWVPGTRPGMTLSVFERRERFSGEATETFRVMAAPGHFVPGVAPATHVFPCLGRSKTWVPGTRPGMTLSVFEGR